MTQNISSNGGNASSGSYTNGSGGNITINDGATTVTTGGGTNDGQTAGIISAVTGTGGTGGTGGSFTKSGNGTFVLSQLNTYTGPTYVNAGFLRANTNNITASANGPFGNNASGLFLNGGTIQSNVATFSRPVTVANNGSGLDAFGSARTIGSTINNATADSTYNFNVGGTTVASAEGQDLTLSGVISNSPGTISLTKIGNSTVSFNSQSVTIVDLEIIAGTLLSTSGVLNLSGNFSNSGTFTHNSGTVNFNGASIQSIGGTTFNNLTINNNAGVTLTANVTFNATLTLTSGIITAGAYSLIGGPTASVSRTSGHVYGNFKKNIALGGTSATFEVGDASNYTPVLVAFASVTTAGGLTARSTFGDHPNIGSSTIYDGKSANRYWTLTNSGIVFTNYNATFTFVSGDLDGGATTGNFIVGRYSAGWTYPTVGTKTSTTTQANSLTAFGDFQLGEIFGVKTFTGTGNFSDAARWTGGTLPVAAENIVIDGTCTIDNNAGTDNITYGTLTIGTSTGRTLSWAAGGTNRLNVSDVSAGAGASTLNMTNGGTLIVGGTWSSTNLTFTPGAGTVEIQSPITLPAAYSTYNNLTISGSGTQTISGTTLDVTGNLSILDTALVTVNAALTVDGDLSIANGCRLSITPASNMSIAGAITNNAGTPGIVLQSDVTGTASLIHQTNNVPATVERYIPGEAEAWHLISSPVSDQAISGSWLPSGSYGNGTGYDLYLWNEPNFCWIYNLNTSSAVNWNTVHPGGDFSVGHGYLYSVQATNPTKEFIGNLNNGPISYELTAQSTDLSLQGFNLVGNPYPSSADWQAVSGWTRSNLINSGGGYDMWIWNPAANNYGVFNSFTGIGTNDITRFIAPMQGYFVQAASDGNLGINNDVRAQDGASSFKNANIKPSVLSLVVESEPDKGFDEVQLLFGYSSNQTGAVKLFSNVDTAPGLFMPSGNEFYSVRYLTDTIENPTIPVKFKPGINGNYTLSSNFEVGHFKTVMLEDRQLHYFHDMKSDGTYRFKASKTDDANRFVLHFGSINDASEKDLPAKIYSDGIHLVIDLTLISKETDVLVYDIMGRKLLQQKLRDEARHSLMINSHIKVLIVHLKNPDGSLVQKVLWTGN
jgi:autotransporter-associated beta strand protein